MTGNASSATDQHSQKHSQNLAKEKPAVTPRDDDNISAVQPASSSSRDDASDTATIFEAFREVSLDLTFSFSTQNSPATSTSESPASEPASSLPPSSARLPSASASAEASPSIHALSRSMSFASQLTPLPPLVKTKKKFSSAKLSPERSTSILRGSWPAIKYVGRGTPVDRNRRKEWSALSTENVTEDGLLFSSDVRAASLDSRSPRLSSSSDWDFLNHGLPSPPRPGKRSFSGHNPVEDKYEEGGKDRVPPLQKIEIKLESGTEDWASVMETVLSSAKKNNEVGVSQPPIIEEGEEVEEAEPGENITQQQDQLPLEELNKLQSELQFDVNLDKALDLGFNPAGDGGTLFSLAGATNSQNSNPTIRRTTTISSGSQYSTPSEGPSDDRPAALLEHQHSAKSQGGQTLASQGFPDVRSTASAQADPHIPAGYSTRVDERLPWWKKALGRFKRAQILLRPHRSTC